MLKGLVSREKARFFSILYDYRQTGDCDDFIKMDGEKVKELYPQAVDFIADLEKLIMLP